MKKESTETCFLVVKKIKILHPEGWGKLELLQLARDISDGANLKKWNMKGVNFTTNNSITTEWMEQ